MFWLTFDLAVHFRPKIALTLEILSDYMHTLPRNSAGHTLFLFFDKQLGNVTSVVEYSKIVTAQQLGDRTMHIKAKFEGVSMVYNATIFVILFSLLTDR